MLIDLATAKLHAAIDGDDLNTTITIYLGAAERAASEYIMCYIYADQAALDAAIAATPTTLSAAVVAYNAAILAADAMLPGDEQDMAYAAASKAYANVKQAVRMTYEGVVVNDQIKTAILLTFADLFENRGNAVIGQSVASIPVCTERFLDPYRAY